VGLGMLGVGVESLLPTGMGVGMGSGTVAAIGRRDVGYRLCLLTRRGLGRCGIDDLDDIDELTDKRAGLFDATKVMVSWYLTRLSGRISTIRI
jgi:hypothetical protein